MAKVAYIDYRPSQRTRKLLTACDAILTSLFAQGIVTTLRGLYYQLVTQNIIENSQKSYDAVSRHISNARNGGWIDWDHVIDATRSLQIIHHWDDPRGIIAACVTSYRLDAWEGQRVRPEVWIEKDALIPTIAATCRSEGVSYVACRGYASTTMKQDAAQRFISVSEGGQKNVVLYVGDHDPSGLDMPNVLRKDMEIYGAHVEIIRLALNIDQVRRYSPPPNFAKETDTRYEAYKAEFGAECWEADALSPEVLNRLIRDAVKDLRDEDIYRATLERQEAERGALELVRDNFDDVQKYVRTLVG